MRVGIVGIGPAGGYLAYLLACQGQEVFIFGSDVEREKPCGGGIPWRKNPPFPILSHPQLKRMVLTRARFISPSGRISQVELSTPVHIFARRSLDGFILGKARQAGACFIKRWVRNVRPVDNSWQIITSEGETYGVDILIGADGANSLVRRRLGIEFPKDFLFVGLGYYIPGIQESDLVIKFLADIEGYIWAFPRLDHVSIGICYKSRAGHSGRKVRRNLALGWLREFIKTYYPNAKMDQATPYSAPIPFFVPTPGGMGVWEWGSMGVGEYGSGGVGECQPPYPHTPIPPYSRSSSRRAGGNWALIGDAGGFTDPITREGIYYALKSAELLSPIILERQSLETFEAICQSHFDPEMTKALHLMGWFYSPGVTERMIRLTSGSKSIRRILGDLIVGEQDYLGLKRRLLRNLIPCSIELLIGYLQARMSRVRRVQLGIQESESRSQNSEANSPDSWVLDSDL